MKRITGTYTTSTTHGEPLQAFVPHSLPPVDPVLAAEAYADLNQQAELALARLSGVSGLAPSVDWLLYGAIRKEALLTSQIEGTQATLIDVFDEEAGFAVGNADDVRRSSVQDPFKGGKKRGAEPVAGLAQRHGQLVPVQIAGPVEHDGICRY